MLKFQVLSFYRTKRLGSGSDFTKFYATLGMAAVDLRYTFDEVRSGFVFVLLQDLYTHFL